MLRADDELEDGLEDGLEDAHDPIKLPGPWVAYWADDTLYCNGERWDSLPRSGAWKGRTVYLVNRAPWIHIGAKLLSHAAPQDKLVGPYRGKPNGLEWTVAGGKACLVSGDAWGLPDDPELATDELRRLAELFSWEPALAGEDGKRWAPSAASLAARILRRMTRKQLTKQLKPRWRTLARAAFYGGPQLALTGGSSAPVVQLDREQAFLQGFFQPVPVPSSWGSVQPGASWAKLRSCHGIALVSVSVSTTAALGPLPVRWLGGVAWPTGHLWGAWTIAHLREAEDAGEIIVEYVHDAQICSLEPWLERVGAKLASVQDKQLRKLLYTRAYGLFAAMGRWSAHPPDPADPMRRNAHWNEHNPAAWSWAYNGAQPYSHQFSPLYQPDLAAWISGSNTTTMVRAIRGVPTGAVHLAHVDALWVDADQAPAIYGGGNLGWRWVRSAPLRVMGTGTYSHGPEHRAQGIPDARDPDTWAELVSGHRIALGVGEATRAWTHGPPHLRQDTSSTPRPLRMPRGIRHIPTWHRSAWSAGDWRARGSDEQPLSAAELLLDANGGILNNPSKAERPFEGA